jgi:hypothetical protein
VLGVKEITVENQDGRRIWWLDEVLEGIEVEYDLDAVRRVRQKVHRKTTGIKDGIHLLIFKVIEESNCPIM